jgi:DNA-binding XRE family transcriptional regulator
MVETQHDRLRRAREACGFRTAAAAADAFGWSRGTYAANENGNARFSWRCARRYAGAFGVETGWLFEDSGPMRAVLGPAPGPVVGSVGHDDEGAVRLWRHGANDACPLDVALPYLDLGLLVEGAGLLPMAGPGALIYFAARIRPPAPELAGHLAVLATRTGRVLVGRLGQLEADYCPLRLTDGEDLGGGVVWASPVTVIVPPVRAAGPIGAPAG